MILETFHIFFYLNYTDMTYNGSSKLLKPTDIISRRSIVNSHSWEVSKVVSCIISKDRGFSIRSSAEHQNFWIWLKLQSKSTFLFFVVFKCKTFLPKYLSLILPFLIYSISKLERCLLKNFPLIHHPRS